MSSCGKGGVENRRAIGASWPVNKLIIPPGEEEESIYIYAVSIPSPPRRRFMTILLGIYLGSFVATKICPVIGLSFFCLPFSFETNDFNDFFSDISISFSSILLFFRETKSRVSRITSNNHRIEELKTFFLGFLHD